MYLNFGLMESRDISLTDVMVLQIAQQNKFEDVGRHLLPFQSDLDKLTQRGLITLIKGKKKDPIYSKYRLTKAGTKMLEDIQIPDVIEYDLTLFKWAAGIYKAAGKELGNQKKTKMHLAKFRVETGIYGNNLAKLLRAFLGDENNMQYNHKLEYALYKPATAFETRFKLEESRLYKYYREHQEEFEKIFE